MRGNEHLDKMELADPAYVEAADQIPEKKKKAAVLSGILAACICLAAAGFALRQQMKHREPETQDTLQAEDGVTIPMPEISLAKSSSGAESDMIGFFIYNGGCYMQYEWIDGNADLIGEKLGTATGLIDEWTPNDGYVELAGSVKGPFYSVKGYDPSFMLCMKQPGGTLCTYVRNTGITLKYGSELYKDRLCLSGNYTAVQYETKDSWQQSRGEIFELGGYDSEITDFIRKLDTAEFRLWSSLPEFDPDTQKPIGDTQLYQLYFRMTNGTTVHLRLYEHGYVLFDGLMDVYLQVPEETFNALIALFRNNDTAEPVTETSMKATTLADCRNDPKLGAYIPPFIPDGFKTHSAEILYDINPITGNVIETKEITVSFNGPSGAFFSITIAHKDDYGQNGWYGPMLKYSELSEETVSAQLKEKESGKVVIDVGVWYGEFSVVLSSDGLDAQTAYLILSSVR